MEEKYLAGGRFWAEATFRLVPKEQSSGSLLASVTMMCLSKSGIYAGVLKHQASIVTDDNGKTKYLPLACLDEGPFVSPLPITASSLLYLHSDYLAYPRLKPVDWDNGYLRVTGRGISREILFDITFKYDGARSITPVRHPEVRRLNNKELVRLFRTGFITTEQAKILLRIQPDRRLLILSYPEDEHIGYREARSIIAELKEVLTPTRELQFPPPFADRLGVPKLFTCELKEGNRSIGLPSPPKTPDSVYLRINGFYVANYRVDGTVIRLETEETGKAEVIYIE